MAELGFEPSSFLTKISGFKAKDNNEIKDGHLCLEPKCKKHGHLIHLSPPMGEVGNGEISV